MHIQHSIPTRVQPSPNVLRIAAMFGLGLDEKQTITIIEPCELHLTAGQLIFLTGPSGSGKSTLLRLIADQSAQAHRIINFNHLPTLPDRPLVDCFGDMPLEQTLKLLSLAGLNDAFTFLRKPTELSDGQRYRLRLARSFALAQEHPRPTSHDPQRLTVILADEFGAMLDRITARTIARNVRKWVDRLHAAGHPICFIAATTHDDLLESLNPDILIEKSLSPSVHIHHKPTPA